VSKILHITASYKPAYIYGGTIQSVGKLCESLVKVGSGKRKGERRKLEDTPKFQVFTTTANGKQELAVKTGKPILIDGVPVTYFKRLTKDHSHFSPALLRALKNVLQHAQHNKINIVIHIHAWWNLVSVLSCLLAKVYKVPVILSPRGMLTAYTQQNRNSFIKKIIHNGIGKLLLRYCHIHVTSEQEKEDVLKIVQPKSITVIPNLVYFQGTKQPKAKSESQSSAFKLLFLSRIEEKKGLDILFEALSAVDFDYRLIIAGSGEATYVESLKRKAENLMLHTHIDWIGQVSNEDKFKLLAAHDLLVLSSYNENFANVVIESLTVGTPVLLSEKVGLADYVRINELGWICNLNPENIAERLNEAFHNRLKRAAIRTNAPKLIAQDFNDEVLSGKYLDLYEKTLRQCLEWTI